MSELFTLQRKVTQLDNDVAAIYTMLAGIEGTQRRHGGRLDQIDNRLDSLEQRLGSMEQGLGSMDAKMDQVIRMLGDSNSS